MTEPMQTSPADEVGTGAPTYVQLTQVRTTLRRTGDALATPDEQGRYPIVAIMEHGGRFRPELLLIAVAIVAAPMALGWSTWAVILGIVAAVGVVAGAASRAVLLPIPEGTQAVMMQAGRVFDTAGPGIHAVKPTVVVSHVVAVREVPFSAVAQAVPTADDIRVDVQILVTFRISEPVKFVFNTTAPDFDVLCQGASQTAIRLAIRAVDSSRVLDLAAKESEALREAVGELLAPYGVTVTRALVVRIDAPSEILHTLEATRLATLHLAEQRQQFELDRRIQTDHETLARQQMQQRLERELEQAELAARVKQLEIERDAESETLRLARLEERLHTYPNAARWDWGSEKLGVARALAGNSRAMIQLSGGTDLADVLLRRTLMDEEDDEEHEDGTAAVAGVDGLREAVELEQR